MSSPLPRRLSPLTPRRIANQLLQLLALVLATAALVLVLTATARPADVPAPPHRLDTTDSRIVEPMGHGGTR
jgi:hypothetical protein